MLTELEVMDGCSSDEVTLLSEDGVTDTTYYIEASGQVTFEPDWTHKLTNCPLEY